MSLETARQLWSNPAARRACAVLVLLAAAVAVYGSLDRAPDESPAPASGDLSQPEAAASQAPVAAPEQPRTQARDSIGAPTDPLPEPLPTSDVSVDLAAANLAQLVSAGGADGLPPLLAALKLAGISVYGPADTVLVQGDGEDQGMYFEAWQVSAMAGLTGSKHASVSLSDLAGGLAKATPPLANEAMAQRLLDGIIEGARTEEGPLRFWARFIVELGRQPHAYPSYDLLDRPDAAAVRLDAIQIALILQRLRAEIGTAAGLEQAFAAPDRSLFSLPVAYASEPCEPTGKRPKPKVTKTAFQGLLDAVTAPSRAMDKFADPSLQNWIDYENLMLMLHAFKVDVEMEGGPPLKRTKTTAAGEQRKVRTTVSLDSKALEWVACFRAWLNSRNKDLRNPPRPPGPVPDVPVDYELDGRAIVRIPISAAGTERGLPDGTKTDAQGMARLAVEGEPQSRNLPETAKEERKEALTNVRVKVKPTHLLLRSAPTEGIASMDFVHEWVLDQEFTIDVAYPFEVMDWSDTPGRWSGKIEFVETTIAADTRKGERAGGSSQTTTTTRATIQVTETVSEHSGSGVFASLKGTIQGTYSNLKTDASWDVDVCGGPAITRRMNHTHRSSSLGTGQGDAVISVMIYEDGNYLVAAQSEVHMPVEGEDRGESERFDHTSIRGRPRCSVLVKNTSVPHVPSRRPIAGMIQGVGKIDPKDPNVLSGSYTEDKQPAIVTEGSTSRTTRTTSWNLRRH